jgi:murein DD-endopeptidase MepM/ murein hydrolase activator NlpD
VIEVRIAALAVALLAAPHAARAQASALAAPAPASPAVAAVEELRARGLEVPVRGIAPDELRDTFDSRRGSGRRHLAIDILAPRGTPVVAVEDGQIRRLSLSNGGGGIVVYQVDPTGAFVYYYAHLEGWADGLAEGDPVTRGQVIGYVGTSGNAPADTPHLHFAVYRLGPGDRGWHGAPVNPYVVYR